MITLTEARPLLEAYLARNPQSLSIFYFDNVYLWQDFYAFAWEVFDGNFCVFAKDGLGAFQYLPPLGPSVSEAVIEKCFSYMEAINGPGGITRIENVPQEMLSFFDEKRYTFYQKTQEYIYRKDDIIALRGNAYKSKRHAYNQFVTAYKDRYEYLPYERSMRDECVALYEGWMAGRLAENGDDLYEQMIRDNFLVEKRALAEGNQLGLVGRVVKIDGRIKAYTFGCVLKKDLFCIAIETADLNSAGLPMYVFRAFCQDPVWEKYPLLNVMDDCAVENMRRTKMSFHPVELLPIYVVKKRD